MRPWLGLMLFASLLVSALPDAWAAPPADLPSLTSWPSDTTLGTPVALVAGDQLDPIMVSDGVGGFIMLWLDFRKPVFDPDLYCQRVSASGDSLWGAGGQVVCSVPGVQNRPTMIADGQGGVFIAWGDLRTSAGGSGYYLQHLGPNGMPRWAANGIRPVSGFNSQAGPQICLDDIGGIFFAFGSANGTQLQRLDSLGIKRLGSFPPAEGTLLRTNPSSASGIVADGLGGAIVALSYGSGSNVDLSALRVAASGTVVWDPGGNTVCAASGMQGPVDIVSDGANGAILAWDDARSGADIYAQRMSAEGDAMWAPNGIALCAEDTTQTGVRLRAQSDGSVVAVWRDYRFLPATSIYAQRVAGDGSVAWALDGVPVCSAAPAIERYSVTPGLGEDTFVAWNTLISSGGDVFAQRIDGAGNRQWGEYGATVCRGPNDQTISAAVGDGRGGLYVGYRDRRDPNEPNMYASHLGAGGVPGPVVGVEAAWSGPVREMLRGAPNPARGLQSLAFARPVAAGARVEVLDLTGRRRVARELSSGAPSWSWDGRDDQGAAVEPGLYFVRVVDGARTAVGRVVRLE